MRRFKRQDATSSVRILGNQVEEKGRNKNSKKQISEKEELSDNC
ncbi:hypothetical protein J53TS2_10300 [Paenibacillus sp. J53TS2]|nr:hypothetical protein J53TS2_10300 [Paenibacillus sp. J53TS2]